MLESCKPATRESVKNLTRVFSGEDNLAFIKFNLAIEKLDRENSPLIDLLILFNKFVEKVT